ncbi:MAG: CRISPR-associated endonuclease Cas2 [Deltaproteobacteria bacterium]|nr:MAG: CRISPR-associated endonuclease Cas2 [Deltaproteobacteria bacterium]
MLIPRSDEIIVIIANDISSNRRRQKIADILTDYGQRVNKSVFECAIMQNLRLSRHSSGRCLPDARTGSSITGYAAAATAAARKPKKCRRQERSAFSVNEIRFPTLHLALLMPGCPAGHSGMVRTTVLLNTLGSNGST